MGEKGCRAWCGRNLADLRRSRRNSGRLRHGADRDGLQSGVRPRDCFRRSQITGAFRRDFQGRRSGCGPGGLDLSRWHSTDPRAQGISRDKRRRGSPPVLIPCIDLQDGQAVQLVHGRRRELAVADVFGLLERFKEYPWLHVIDLDAAMRKGENNKLVEELCRRAKTDYGMKVRVGGGIRKAARAKRLVKLGAEQVILGSAVFVEGEINLKLLRELT